MNENKTMDHNEFVKEKLSNDIGTFIATIHELEFDKIVLAQRVNELENELSMLRAAKNAEVVKDVPTVQPEPETQEG